MKKSHLFLFLTITCLICFFPLFPAGKTRHVNPFIGTGGHGHTFPGASLPFGGVQLSPDTRLTGWDGCSGYHFTDTVIYGFSHTHLSGTGASDYGDILFMPSMGPVQLERGTPDQPQNGYCATFNHQNEKAEPGYYRVKLSENNILVELTVTPRVGVHQYTFPRGAQANVIIDLTHRDTVLDSRLTIVGDREIEGFRRSQAWAKDQYIYFVARFSQPFNSYGLTNNQSLPTANSPADIQGQNVKGFISFKNKKGLTLQINVGISAVSIAGARKNLESEAGQKNFQDIRRAAQKQWEHSLNKISITGGTAAQKQVFYSALYHCLLQPNLFMDVDQQYRGRDLAIHQANGYTNYTVFSLWDTFRATHPLYTLLEPQRTVDFIQTFITQYEQGGLLPVWELAGNETFCMIGYHAIPVIVDAYIKGIRSFPLEKAYQAMLHSANQAHFGLKDYRQCGFVLGEKESESVSKTLEYAYDDWCIAQMARSLGKQQDYQEYLQRAQYYKNLFDPSTGFMRARLKGFWFTPFDPLEVNFNYTEANAWQYRFAVPQDISGLVDLLGGVDHFTRQLDGLFSAPSQTTGRQQADITGLIGQYAHGNEPSHHLAYLYNFAGQPWKTQHMVRHIMDTLYTAKPDGLCGNEDCGQMSAWYVFSALGFYPVTPGTDIYTIGSPLFPHAEMHLDNGHTFTILAQHLAPQNTYIQSVTLNGKPYSKTWIHHNDITKGGTLTFTMGTKPNTQWGAQEENRTISAITEFPILPVPYISGGLRSFTDSTFVTLACLEPETTIFYTLDGSTPDSSSSRYQEPIAITHSCTLKAIAMKAGFSHSFVLTAYLDKISRERTIVLHSIYSPQYSAGGDSALIDGCRGGLDFRTGTWQGYEGTDFQAVITLEKPQTIQKVSIGFLQNSDSWIFLPVQVDFYTSSDGTHFAPVATVKNDIPPQQEGSFQKDFTATLEPTPARYVKVVAHALGLCPTWHKGAGEKAWIFTDEIIIE